MRNLVFLLFLGVVVFAVVGWFLDWYDVTGVRNSNGKTSIQLEYNGSKVKEDLGKGVKKFNETVEQIRDEKKVPQNQ